ncbi:hypothetical protein GCM10025881_18830 [Pseudolysinimonas kribbensis]|uniref:Uncharacterized protein n=1 Tax=Pseudolysinimonas kribbensis TaxID=433641 RepID=A0ABQ6K710_9MICO|nr:hypothetical protein GCM10025881_18830 [Pseudolysinimonas kribbensis]
MWEGRPGRGAIRRDRDAASGSRDPCAPAGPDVRPPRESGSGRAARRRAARPPGGASRGSPTGSVASPPPNPPDVVAPLAPVLSVPAEAALLNTARPPWRAAVSRERPLRSSGSVRMA